MNCDDMQDPQIIIERLNIRLPEGFATRADSIARQVGKQLRYLGLSNARDLTLDRLEINGLKAAAGETDSVIARRIAQAVHRQVTKQVSQPVVPACGSSSAALTSNSFNDLGSGLATEQTTGEENKHAG